LKLSEVNLEPGGKGPRREITSSPRKTIAHKDGAYTGKSTRDP